MNGKMFNTNKDGFQSKVDHPWTAYTVLLLPLWPWPWPNDLDMWTWPRYSKDVSAYQQWTFWVKVFNS